MKKFILTILICLWSHCAVAHSPLNLTIPSDGSLITELPDKLILEFKGSVRLTLVTIKHNAGGVEKEIERGNKRIEVQKYKDEGVKSRTGINMKKNDQYKNDLKNSTFNSFPKQVYDNSIKNKI